MRSLDSLRLAPAHAVERVCALVRSNPDGYGDLAGRLAEQLAPVRPAEAVSVWGSLSQEQQRTSQEFFFVALGNSDSAAAAQCMATMDKASQVKVLPRYCEGHLIPPGGKMIRPVP